MGARGRVVLLGAVVAAGVFAAWRADRRGRAEGTQPVKEEAVAPEEDLLRNRLASFEPEALAEAKRRIVAMGEPGARLALGAIRDGHPPGPYADVLGEIGAPVVPEMIALATAPEPEYCAPDIVRALGRIRDATADEARRARVAGAIRPSFPLSITLRRLESDYEVQRRAATSCG